MRTITTKHLVASGRTRATDCDGNSINIAWKNALNREENYLNAALALCKKMGLSGITLHGGYLKEGMVWVVGDKQLTHTIEKEPDPSTIAQRESEIACASGPRDTSPKFEGQHQGRD